MYNVDSKATLENIKKWDNDRNTFYRFQNPQRELDENSCSWGMIYKSMEEAEEDGCEILNGKSCVDTFKELSNYVGCFGKGYVVLVFNGHDAGQIGHDGETVARFYEKVAVIDFKEAQDALYNIEYEAWDKLGEDWREYYEQ